MSFPATSPTKETPGVTFSVTSRRSLDCGRPTTGSDEGNSSRDFEMNRLAVHHSHYRAHYFWELQWQRVNPSEPSETWSMTLIVACPVQARFHEPSIHWPQLNRRCDNRH